MKEGKTDRKEEEGGREEGEREEDKDLKSSQGAVTHYVQETHRLFIRSRSFSHQKP